MGSGGTHYLVLCKEPCSFQSEIFKNLPEIDKKHIFTSEYDKKIYFYLYFRFLLKLYTEMDDEDADFIAKKITGFEKDYPFDFLWAKEFFKPECREYIFLKFLRNILYDMDVLLFLYKNKEKNIENCIRCSPLVKILNIFLKNKNFIIIYSNKANDFNTMSEMTSRYGVEICDIEYFFDFLINLKIREDEVNSAIVIYDRNECTRICLSEKPYVKSFYPEKVNARIVKNSFHENFISKNSTESYASLRKIEYYASALCEMNIFEINFCNGESILHPFFEKIVDIFHEYEINVSFSVYRNSFVDLFPSERIRKEIYQKTKEIFVNVSSVEEIKTKYEKLVNDISNFDYLHSMRIPFVIHNPYFSDTQKTLDIIRYCNTKEFPMVFYGNEVFHTNEKYPMNENLKTLSALLFLTYKDVFSSDEDEKQFFAYTTAIFPAKGSLYPEWYENYFEMREKGKLSIPYKEEGIHFCKSLKDDSFSQDFRNLLTSLSIPNYVRDEKCGKFSICIDMVNNMVSSSFFADKKYKIGNITNLVEELEEYWKKM